MQSLQLELMPLLAHMSCDVTSPPTQGRGSIGIIKKVVTACLIYTKLHAVYNLEISMGPNLKKVSSLERCPDFRGEMIHVCIVCIGSKRSVQYTRGVLISGCPRTYRGSTVEQKVVTRTGLFKMTMLTSLVFSSQGHWKLVYLIINWVSTIS